MHVLCCWTMALSTVQVGEEAELNVQEQWLV